MLQRSLLVMLMLAAPVGADTRNRFDTHGSLRVAKSGTHLEHADGTPFFFLADTCWTGPALSNAEDWQTYLRDRAAKKFTAIQFNIVSPWRTAPTDASGRRAYDIVDRKLVPNEAFYQQVDARLRAINDAGMLAVPVLAWALKKGDAGIELSEEQLVMLLQFEVARYRKHHCLFILAGDHRYAETGDRWKRIGRAVFKDHPDLLATTHPTGMAWPWKEWENEPWLKVLGYQSGHGDGEKAYLWIVNGPPAEYGRRERWSRPVINLEPPYEAHRAYQSKQPHSAYSVRRATYWSLLVHPMAGVTYGGHGVWSWHTKPGEPPTDHANSGPAKAWKDALNLEFATQLPHLVAIIESLPWTELRPAPALLANANPEPSKFIACAATADRKVIAAYVPAGARAAFADGAVQKPRTITWHNPRTGKTVAGTLETPDDQDWVLVIRQ